MLRVLGSVRLADGSTPRSRAQRIIVAALVLDAGTNVGTERLADLVWGDDPPADPDGALQNHVSRLRKVLPGGATIRAAGSGYRLDAAPGLIDVVELERRMSDARDEPDTRTRLAHADDGLTLWNGVPYLELDDTRAAAEAVRITDVHRRLREWRSAALIDLGRATDAIGDLESLRVEDPLRERTTELLMRAYAADGRTTDALATYADFRRELVEQTGLDPSPALRELETSILTEELEPRSEPERPARDRRPFAVPASTFVGRDADMAAIVERLTSSRLVTLVGPGGVGKTRLATHVAAAAVHADTDVDLVELVPLQADQIAEAIATALDVQPRANSTATERIVDALVGQPRLIVLDNCEHVVDAVAELVDQIVRHTTDVTVLTTSREPLNVDAESVIRIAPLDVEGAAVELFTDRATTIGGPLGDEAGACDLIIQICRALDGLPLAIELAAAQTGSMTLAEIAAGVEEPLAMPGRGRRTVADRHRSLRSLIEWSARELDDDVLTVFTATAAFAGPFTTAAMATVSGLPPERAAVAVAELVDRSLVVTDPRPGTEMHFSTLQTIRSYAAELLDAAPDGTGIRNRRDEWVMELVAGVADTMSAWAAAEARRFTVVHLDDLRAAHLRFLRAGDSDRALRLALALHFPAMYRMSAEMFGWIAATADQFGHLEHRDAESVVASASVGAWQSGDLDRAREYAERAGAAAERSSWPGAGRGAAEAFADVTQFSGDNQGSLELFARALDIARAEPKEPRIFNNLTDLAMVAGYLGETERAREAIDEARRWVADDAPDSARAWVAYAAGEAMAEHDPVAAMASLDRAIELAERSGSTFIVGAARLTRTGLSIRSGDPAAAVPGLIDLLDHWRHGGALVQQWITLRSVVELLLRLERLREAAYVLGAIAASGSMVEPSGADSARLDAAESTIRADLPDADQALTEWAGRPLDAVVEDSIAYLLDAAAVRLDEATS